MSEQSQFARLRRSLIRLVGRVAPSALPRLFKLTSPEQAALDRRASTLPMSARPEASLCFAIPLVGKHQVGNWGTVNRALDRTIGSLMRQSDAQWQVVICGQDAPDCVGLDDRISFLPFKENVEGHDKVPKLRALARHCVPDVMAGWYMPLDGDDLLAPGFVAACRAGHPKGLLVAQGYIHDGATGDIGATRPRSLREIGQKPFWKFCGSCMALPLGQDRTREARFFEDMARHEHRLYPYLAELAGHQLQSPKQALVLYQINHGENFEARRGRGGFKTRFVQRFKVADMQELKRIAADFFA